MLFSYFVIHFDVPPSDIDGIKEKCNRDVDVVRNRIYKKGIPEQFDCTFHEEMLPPAYRFLYFLYKVKK